MSANRQHFLIFPNSQNDWKRRWLSVEKESSNKQGVKVGVFNWIFNPLKTANLNIFFSPVEQIFYHFRKANSDISKGWMIIMMINWLKLVPVSEKSSHIFFNLKDDSVWSITLGCANKNTLGKGPMLYFRFVGGTCTHSRSGWN